MISTSPKLAVKRCALRLATSPDPLGNGTAPATLMQGAPGIHLRSARYYKCVPYLMATASFGQSSICTRATS